MPRIALGLEYDGTAFSGWQRQAHAASVQAALERAVGRVADVAGPLEVVCAGRTDAGVHATGQVVHFDTDAERPARAWVRGVNSHLPASIGVRWAAWPGDDFHARFSATARRYRYILLSDPLRPVLRRDRVAWTWKPLSLKPMQAAAQCLLGEHDFSAFRAVACQAKHPVRTVRELTLHRLGDCIVLDIEANAFLHHMVRNIAGVLMAVGAGERPVEWVAEVLAGRDRTRGGVTAPPGGLYLTAVRYPERFGLPDPAPPPAFA
ncbi:tRNA pseudouridine(38-40) synthase TruA [Sediminicurvatus halobius]|uniref:tRNA pseudouridine synthase A n=1 Tax=Sediminicurvatus halobius TaxID=2182432 RepID=A0A2U2MWD0_9GAMM|nr:tRNA pseudouridine(38-40) synthase TruA [Spiribacter halobius]PWG61163.1 tRNA pseudouridine(38-40) synthase TruA [Spiribacter halobius]UEX78983.1 tRNA pseudouridine(38-40) synthase TruA [Spiribacter halobius]